MVYMNSTKKRDRTEYSKDYYQKNREKIMEKSREYRKTKAYQLNREKRRKHALELNNKNKKAIIKLLGTKCCFCESEEMICYHEIHGKPHPKNLSYIRNHPEDFIAMCHHCHCALHHLLHSKNLNIETFMKMLIALRYQR